MEFFKKNLKWIVLILFFLLCVKSFQSCLRKSENTRLKENLSEICDSLVEEKVNIIINKDLMINSLENEIVTRDFIIKDQENDLEIAGVRVDAAERRADAIQRTAEMITTNTTIEFKGVEEIKDTIINEKNN